MFNWYGFYYGIGSVVAQIKKDQEYLSSLAPEERKKKWKEDDEHGKNLEIAEAGRPRNFWGK